MNIDGTEMKIDIRKNDWDLILRQTKEQLKAQLIQLKLTIAVIHEMELQKEDAQGADEPPLRTGS